VEHRILTQAVRFLAVGALGTAVNALIYLVVRAWWDPLPANLFALVLSTAVSTEANRRFTFGGAAVHLWRARVQAFGTVLFYGFYSSAVLLLLGALVANPTPVGESIAVALASVLGGIARFLVMRNWMLDASGVGEPPPPRLGARVALGRGLP
jgi:putative flippase GtrA